MDFSRQRYEPFPLPCTEFAKQLHLTFALQALHRAQIKLERRRVRSFSVWLGGCLSIVGFSMLLYSIDRMRSRNMSLALSNQLLLTPFVTKNYATQQFQVNKSDWFQMKALYDDNLFSQESLKVNLVNRIVELINVALRRHQPLTPLIDEVLIGVEAMNGFDGLKKPGRPFGKDKNLMPFRALIDLFETLALAYLQQSHVYSQISASQAISLANTLLVHGISSQQFLGFALLRTNNFDLPRQSREKVCQQIKQCGQANEPFITKNTATNQKAVEFYVSQLVNRHQLLLKYFDCKTLLL